MTILITGGAGYIGSNTVLNFCDAGEGPIVIDNLSTGFDWLVPESVQFYQEDVSNKDAVLRIIKSHDVDTVVHFAGSISVPESVENPLKYYRDNKANSVCLLEACVEGGVRNFVFSSTAAVYGLPEQNPVREDAVLKPFTPYGTSKLMTEWILRDTAAAHDLNYTVLRYFNVAGADPDARAGQATANATSLIKVALEVAQGRREKLVVFGSDYETPDGTGIRDYIHVTDLAVAHRLAVERLRAGGVSGAMNCGYGTGYSVLEVVDAIKAVSGVDFTVEIGPRRPGDAPNVIADSSLAKSELGWAPRHADLREIVRHSLAWEETMRTRNRL